MLLPVILFVYNFNKSNSFIISAITSTVSDACEKGNGSKCSEIITHSMSVAISSTFLIPLRFYQALDILEQK